VLDGDGVVLERGVERLFRNFDLLGSPIGDAAYCKTFVRSFTAKGVKHTLGPLSSLDDPRWCIYWCDSAGLSAGWFTFSGACRPFSVMKLF